MFVFFRSHTSHSSCVSGAVLSTSKVSTTTHMLCIFLHQYSSDPKSLFCIMDQTVYYPMIISREITLRYLQLNMSKTKFVFSLNLIPFFHSKWTPEPSKWALSIRKQDLYQRPCLFPRLLSNLIVTLFEQAHTSSCLDCPSMHFHTATIISIFNVNTH